MQAMVCKQNSNGAAQGKGLFRLYFVAFKDVTCLTTKVYMEKQIL